MTKKTRKILGALSLLGFIDAFYLSLPYFTDTTTFCISENINACDLVLNSSYAELFFGIPNAFLGVLFYATLTLIFIFWEKIFFKIKNILKLSIFITTIGVLFYLYFIYLQAFVIESYCPYCLLSAVITFFIWIKLILVYNRK